LHPLAIDEDAVGAVQIPDQPVSILKDHLDMLAADMLILDAHLAFVCPADAKWFGKREDAPLGPYFGPDLERGKRHGTHAETLGAVNGTPFFSANNAATVPGDGQLF